MLLVEVLVRFRLAPCPGSGSCLAGGADDVDIAEAERAGMGDLGGRSMLESCLRSSLLILHRREKDGKEFEGK